jgi:site-specific DNA recombinase
MIDTTTPTGRFNFRNISSASELERELIKERTQMGFQALARRGEWPNDDPPLGYDRAQDGRLEIVPEEACLVRFIFERYRELKSMPKVAEELNARKQSLRDSEWTPYAVGKVLKNELYTGEYSLAGVEKFIQEYQIIKPDEFEQTTQVRTRFKRQGSSDRPEMSKERKTRLVQNVVDQYIGYLTKES